MSSRPYQLWTCPDAGAVPQACTHTRPVSTICNLSTTAFVREPAPHLAGSIVPTGTAPSLYSDVAASRPLSPVKETIPLHPTESAVREEATIVPHPTESTVDVISTNDYEKLEHDTSSDLSNWSKRQDNAPWIIIECRCARSLSSLERAQKDRERFLTLKLNREQKQTIHAATNTLTTKERQRILRHHEKMVAHRDSSLSSRGEGPSRLKGKAIDPREWGNTNISQESLDLGAQTAALESLKQPMNPPMRHGSLNRWDKHRPAVRPAESQPAAQITPNSYLGTALRDIDQQSSQTSYLEGIPTPSSPSSELSDLDSESRLGYDSSVTPVTATVHGFHRRQDNRHGPNRSQHSSSSHHESIEPIPSKEYDGSLDAWAYHHFVRESSAYLRDGNVRGHQKVFLLLYYLAGKAYDFYTQKVSMNEDK